MNALSVAVGAFAIMVLMLVLSGYYIWTLVHQVGLMEEKIAKLQQEITEERGDCIPATDDTCFLVPRKDKLCH